MHAARKTEKDKVTNWCAKSFLFFACLPCSESYLRGFWPSASLGGLKGAEAENSHTLKLMRVLDAVREQCELVFLSHPRDINRPEAFAQLPSLNCTRR